ncbi:MAG: hypothetical protein HFF38_13200 [Lawsonibacter sp.]|jgi:chromosomal replication initiator protein|nr:hypothetical protein [Lawsonibacter sp.]
MNNDFYIIEIIKKVVVSYFHIAEQDLRAKDKSKKVVYARHIGMYLCRKLTSETYPRIGLEFGGRDPKTVIYAYNKIDKSLKSNTQLVSDVKEITSQVTNLLQKSF